MRETKFRAWIEEQERLGDKIKAHMYYFAWHQIRELGTIHIRGEKSFHPQCLGCDECGKDSHPPIMQYTGLKDKNGKEIYEGDICKMHPGFGCEWNKSSFIVSIDWKYASFWAKTEHSARPLDPHDCDYEVIGNIYENPELIGDKNGKM